MTLELSGDNLIALLILTFRFKLFSSRILMLGAKAKENLSYFLSQSLDKTIRGINDIRAVKGVIGCIRHSNFLD